MKAKAKLCKPDREVTYFFKGFWQEADTYYRGLLYSFKEELRQEIQLQILLKTFSSPKQMFMRYFIFYVSVIIFLHACSSTTPDFPQQSFRSRLSGGDHHMGWSLNYFDSWQNGLQPRYLQLAEQHTIAAIKMFAHLESDTSPRISEFYVVRERRTRSCRLLAEIQFAAGNHGYKLSSRTPDGCVYFY